MHEFPANARVRAHAITADSGSKLIRNHQVLGSGRGNLEPALGLRIAQLSAALSGEIQFDPLFGPLAAKDSTGIEDLHGVATARERSAPTETRHRQVEGQ